MTTEPAHTLPTPPPYRYQSLWWYRHASDTDQSIRTCWQMAMGANTEADILHEAARMYAQGYRVQRVVLQLVCTTCAGNARLAKRRKNARKDSRGNYAVYYVECKACQGDGWTEAGEVSTFVEGISHV